MKLEQFKDVPLVRFAGNSLDNYFRPRPWESGDLYPNLGVGITKKIVSRNAPVRYLLAKSDKTTNYHLHRPTLEEASRFESWSRFNEVVHVGTLALSVAGVVRSALEGHVGGMAFYGAMGFASAELVMLQRYNRARIYRIRERREQLMFNKSSDMER